MTIRGWCVILISLIAVAARADTPAPQTKSGAKSDKSEILARYSYEEIQAVSNYLSVVLDRSLTADGKPRKAKKVLPCDPPIAKVKYWSSGPIHELMDLKRASEIEAYLRDPASYMAKAKNCSERCACNAYALVLSDTEERAANKDLHKSFDQMLTDEAKKETTAQDLKCAQDLKWFCGSPFHGFLKTQ